jgi:lysozyme family protein
MKFEDALRYVLAEEGGYVNHPKDPGGVTNLGVTKRAWEDFKGGSVTDADMRSLTRDKVAPFYRHMYWDKCRCDSLPSGVDFLVFDTAVNMGVGAASKLLQEAVGAKPDGVVGPATIAVTKALDSYAVVTEIAFLRAIRYMKTKNVGTFGAGWANRLIRVKDMALNASKNK